METYDAIIIGSGMGGLTAGSLLAQTQGKRVLILEHHYTPHRLGACIGAANTPIKGLLLAGADAGLPGIEGALVGGVLAVAATMGPAGFPTLMRQAAQRARTRPKPALTALEPPVTGKLAISISTPPCAKSTRGWRRGPDGAV